MHCQRNSILINKAHKQMLLHCEYLDLSWTKTETINYQKRTYNMWMIKTFRRVST